MRVFRPIQHRIERFFLDADLPASGGFRPSTNIPYLGSLSPIHRMVSGFDDISTRKGAEISRVSVSAIKGHAIGYAK